MFTAQAGAQPGVERKISMRRDKNQQQADQADQVIVVQIAGLFEQKYIGKTEEEKSGTEAVEETG